MNTTHVPDPSPVGEPVTVVELVQQGIQGHDVEDAQQRLAAPAPKLLRRHDTLPRCPRLLELDDMTTHGGGDMC